MSKSLTIPGIHHITAIAASPVENKAFYQRVLGLRLVKQTVNFDDPYTYHLYYGDRCGTPGTIMTFFPWEAAPHGRIGAGMIIAVAFAIEAGSLAAWKARLAGHGVRFSESERFGAAVITFKDPHGLPLELIAEHQRNGAASDGDTRIPAIIGFHSATALVNELEASQALLKTMGLRRRAAENNRHRFETTDPEAYGHLFDLVVDPDAAPGRQGSGTVHHIAFRTGSDEEQIGWQQRLAEHGAVVTPVRDRNYFKSIYFHEPAGILFEIATDPPGFTVDEPEEQLGTSLMLPQHYEPRRGEIEQHLVPLKAPELIHSFTPAEAHPDDGTTIVALHGTGGDEHDLVPLARKIQHSAAILSSRGPVLEDGMNRFFKRLAPNVFSEHDIVRRAYELDDFLQETVRRYHRSAEHLIALGYSNGANIAGALLFLRPELFSRAILLRPMLVLTQPPLPMLADKPVLILRGRHDRVIPAKQTDRLIEMLERAGAGVSVVTVEAGHELTEADLAAAAGWIRQTVGHSAA